MFAILNKSERLITTHLGDALPPGLPVAVSEVIMEHPSMQALANEGLLEVVEIQDPPPPPEPTPTPTPEPTTEGGARVQQPPTQQRPAPNPPTQQSRS